MSQANQLIRDIALARAQYLKVLTPFSESQAQWQPSPEVWNAVAITEHLFWAEQGGLLGMWKTLHAQRVGQRVWEGEAPHSGLPIEAIIDLTWKAKEQVPAVAAPRMGGPLAFWTGALSGLQVQLEHFAQELRDEDLSIMAHPHPISGPLDLRQRLEFLRFHLDRHRGQVLERWALVSA